MVPPNPFEKLAQQVSSAIVDRSPDSQRKTLLAIVQEASTLHKGLNSSALAIESLEERIRKAEGNVGLIALAEELRSTLHNTELSGAAAGTFSIGPPMPLISKS